MARQPCEEACTTNTPLAMLNLAYLYQMGQGMEKPDYGKARELYRMSADLQNPVGILLLGSLYLEGNDTGSNPIEALYLYEKAYRGNQKTKNKNILSLIQLAQKHLNADTDFNRLLDKLWPDLMDGLPLIKS